MLIGRFERSRPLQYEYSGTWLWPRRIRGSGICASIDEIDPEIAMKKHITLTTLAACILTLFAGNLFACGESLFRVGKGVAFREYTAPLPGTVLVVANSEAEMALVERLAAAGHDIHVVSDPSQIGEELQNHQIDVVLAYYSAREVVEVEMASNAHTTYIPVAMGGTPEVKEADQQYQRSLSNEDTVQKFLKTIHRTLKSQS